MTILANSSAPFARLAKFFKVSDEDDWAEIRPLYKPEGTQDYIGNMQTMFAVHCS